MGGQNQVTIPLKLQRFLMTIARRKNISEIRVAAVITQDEKLILSQENALPHMIMGKENINDVLDRLMKEMCLDCAPVRYVGYFDVKDSRQYNFRIEAAPHPNDSGFRLVNVDNALKLLCPAEAEVVLIAMGRI